LKSMRMLKLCCIVLVAALCCGCPHARDPEAYRGDLKSDNEETRKRAVEELVRMGSDAIPHVVTWVKDPDENVREGAAKVLMKARTTDALDAVATLIERPDPSLKVRVAAVQAMGKLAEVRKSVGVELLGKALREGKQAEYVKAAAQSLRDLHYNDATELLIGALREGKGLAAVYSAHALYSEERLPLAAEFLLQSLSSSQPAVSEAARQCVDELSDRFVDEILAYLEKHPDAAGARRALRATRDKLLEELGKSLMPERVREIVTALGKIADTPSVEKLMEIAAGKKMSLSGRAQAALALATSALSARSPASLDGRIRNFLEKALHDEALDIKVRIASAISLCKLRQRSGVTYLLAQLSEAKEADTELRIRAQEALAASKEFVVPYLIRKLADPRAGPTMCWAAAKTLGELRAQEALPRLVNLLDRTEPYVRWTAAIALGQIGGQEALSALQSAMQNESDPTVLFYIRRALKGLGAQPAA